MKIQAINPNLHVLHYLDKLYAVGFNEYHVVDVDMTEYINPPVSVWKEYDKQISTPAKVKSLLAEHFNKKYGMFIYPKYSSYRCLFKHEHKRTYFRNDSYFASLTKDKDNEFNRLEGTLTPSKEATKIFYDALGNRLSSEYYTLYVLDEVIHDACMKSILNILKLNPRKKKVFTSFD